MHPVREHWTRTAKLGGTWLIALFWILVAVAWIVGVAWYGGAWYLSAPAVLVLFSALYLLVARSWTLCDGLVKRRLSRYTCRQGQVAQLVRAPR